MNAEWMLDARKIPDEVMNYLRRIAVQAVEEKHYSPELVADLFGIDRTSIYDWLRKYRHEGEEALDTRKAPGAPGVITPDIDQWLKDTIVNSTPADHGYDTVLWTLEIIVDLLKTRFDLWISDAAVRIHLHRLGLSCQQPCYQALAQDPERVKKFLDEEFKDIQKLAQELGADIAFEDESWIQGNSRSGRTWGLVGHPPQIKVSDDQGGFHVLSMVTAAGELIFDMTTEKMVSSVYIKFLENVLSKWTHPLIVITDNASYHTSNEVKKFIEDHAQQIRLFFLPPHSPKLNPDEQVWNEIKHRQLEKQPIKNRKDFKNRVQSALKKLQECKEKVQSFFELKDTRYAGLKPSSA